MRTKDFQHTIHEINKDFLGKEREIAVGDEENPDVLFQLFQHYESYLVPRFQEAIGKMRWGLNRRDPKIKKEHLMAEALSSHDTLVLGKKCLTQDPKSFAFASFVTNVSTSLDILHKTGCKSNNTKKKNKLKKKTDEPRNDKRKFEPPKKVNQE